MDHIFFSGFDPHLLYLVKLSKDKHYKMIKTVDEKLKVTVYWIGILLFSIFYT